MPQKVFMVRHQRGGIVAEHVFMSEPTPEQMAPIVAEMRRLHGAGGDGKPEPWIKIHEALLYRPGEIPAYPARAAVDVAGVSQTQPFGFSGSGEVK